MSIVYRIPLFVVCAILLSLSVFYLLSPYADFSADLSGVWLFFTIGVAGCAVAVINPDKIL